METLYAKISEAQKIELGYHYGVLDFDNTCIINDIGEAVIVYLCEYTLLRDFSLLPTHNDGSTETYHESVLQHYYALGKNSDRTLCCIFAAQCLSGFSITEIHNLVDQVISHEGTVIGTRTLYGLTLNTGIIQQSYISDLYTYTIKNHIDVWIVSASSKYIVAAAIDILFPELQVRIIGIENTVTNGIIDSHIIMPISAHVGKLTHIKTDIDEHTRPLFVIGDSMNDYAMLSYAHIPVVVDRENELSKKARTEGWFLIPSK